MPDKGANVPEQPKQHIEVPADLAGGFECRAVIHANAPRGVEVRGVKEGDVVKINSIAGWCSFSKGSPLGIMASIVTAVIPLVPGAGAVAKVAKVLDAAKKAGDFKKNAPSKGKVRSGYGKIRGKNEWAAKEGGIIVCMPSAGGPIPAGGNHLDGGAEKDGRLPRYVPEPIRDMCFFPCRFTRAGGRMEMRASQDGSVFILVFDSKHEDNTGSYDVAFTVTR